MRKYHESAGSLQKVSVMGIKGLHRRAICYMAGRCSAASCYAKADERSSRDNPYCVRNRESHQDGQLVPNLALLPAGGRFKYRAMPKGLAGESTGHLHQHMAVRQTVRGQVQY